MKRLSLSVIAVTALVAMSTPAPVGAIGFGADTTYDKLVFLTFSKPVQVPGATLTAGTYRFRLANPDTSRNVLQVLSRDGRTVYAMFHTMPDARASLTNEATVSFRETPSGVPPAVRSLFYGGEHGGYEFLYPRGGPIMTVAVKPQADVTYTPVAIAPVTLAPVATADRLDTGALADTPAPTAVVAEATPEPAALAPADATPAPVAAAEPEQAQQDRQELPHTASPLPLAAIGGMGSLLASLGLGLIRRRV